MNHFDARAKSKDNYYTNTPNLPVAIVALVLWVLVLIAIVYRSWRYKIWYLTVLVVGLLMEIIGYIMRIYGHFQPGAYNPYVTMQALTILAPVMFAAANYVIFGRLLHYGHLLYPGVKLTWLPTKNVVAVFVTSDVISFLVQVGGAILLLNKNGDTSHQKTGESTLMAGLAINLASFCFFFTLIIYFEHVTRKLTHSQNLKRHYAPILWAAMFSQIFLIGRSVYRVIEFQQGYSSHLAITEIYFYFFDTLIMLLATGIYIPFFPPAFGLLGKQRLADKLREGSIEMGGLNHEE